MVTNKKQRPLYQRIAIDIAGFGLMILAPFLGWLPGPGGIPLFLAGLGLVSLNHEWAARLLRDFDKKRVEFTEKYLMTSPRVSITVDFVSLVALAVGSYLAYSFSGLWQKVVGLVLVSLSVIVLLSNQKRLERIAGRIKKR